MRQLLSEDRFDYVSRTNKEFIAAFSDAMSKQGYTWGGQIGGGYCWGIHMIIYAKTTAKSKKVVARIYLREKSICLRLFLNNIDKHREFIEKSPAHILRAFTNDVGNCQHCHNQRDDQCRFQKSYTLAGKRYEKCSGITFEFDKPVIKKLQEYLNLLREFYPERPRREALGSSS